MTNNNQKNLFSKPQLALYVLALLFLVAGIVLTPNLLIKLGPMRVSLTSEIESVKRIAYAEVTAAKIGLFILALLLLAIGIYWQQIVHSSFVRSINAHVPLIDRAGMAGKLNLFNLSFFVMLGSTVIGFWYVIFGPNAFDEAQLSAINREDGLIEYATVLFLFVSFVLSAILSFKFSGRRARVIVHALMAFAFFVMIGEEISWGQRLLNINTPAALEGNVQGETNLHNMFGYFADHIFIASVLLYGVLLPILVQFNAFARKFFDLIGLPVASLGLALGFLMASLLQRWIVYKFVLPPPEFRIEELREMLVMLALSLLMLESWQLARHK